MDHSCRAMVLASASLAVAACAPEEPPLQFERDGDAFILSGVIDQRALNAFETATQMAPGTKTLIFDFVPGSIDDESNIALARLIREGEFTTIIPGDGLVASGGTDLFLAGSARTISAGACVGVHTWGDDQNVIGADVPREDPVHDIYLDYYQDMGVDPEFYWFTLDAAGIDESHWMSREELREFRLIPAPENAIASAPATNRHSSCEARLENGFDALLEEK